MAWSASIDLKPKTEVCPKYESHVLDAEVMRHYIN